MFEICCLALAFRLILVLEYTEGHCNVPGKYKDNPALGSWCGTQRQRKKKGKLAQDKIDRLNAIGFVWGESFDVLWDRQFEALIAYKEKVDDCNVPQRYEDNPTLGAWCNKQRIDKKKGKLSQDKIDRLDAIGFVWSFR